MLRSGSKHIVLAFNPRCARLALFGRVFLGQAMGHVHVLR